MKSQNIILMFAAVSGFGILPLAWPYKLMLSGVFVIPIFLLQSRLIRISKQAKAYKTERDELQRIFDSTGAAIWTRELTSNRMKLSAGFEPLFGLSRSEAESSPDLWLNKVYEKDVGKLNDMRRELRAGRPSNAEYRIHAGAEGYKWIHAWGNPVCDDSGNVVKVIGLLLDITESKKADELLQKSDRLAVVSELAAGVAHEIRNPLTTIKGFLQLFLEKGSCSPQYIQVMLEEAQRIDFIVSEFLCLAKPQADKYEPSDLIALLGSTMKLMETRAAMQGVSLSMETELADCTIRCEKQHLRQVFVNVMNNAIESMPEGGEVQIGAVMTKNNEVAVSVTDHGCGISEERLSKLGEPFYTTKDKGTGLGLMVCYKIIESHLGSIRIESAENRGTSVEIRLPV